MELANANKFYRKSGAKPNNSFLTLPRNPEQTTNPTNLTSMNRNRRGSCHML